MDRAIFDTEIRQLLSDAAAMIPVSRFSEPAPDLNDWFRWEMDLWNLGEQIRQFCLHHNRSMSQDQAHAVLRICLNLNAGKGRQSFVLLLGKTKYSPLSEEVSSLLSDPDVQGHVINTLYKMKAPGYADRIRPFLRHPQTWIRKEAARYLRKYP